MGPNVKKLIAHKASLDMVPRGGGIVAAVASIAEPGKLGRVMREATAWVQQAIAVVKTAPDNGYGDDDEAIAGAILQKIDDRKRRGRQ